MKLFARVLKNKRATASAMTIALIAGVPATFAVLHPGFPVTDVQLNSRDVWTTNARDVLAGRLNKQIDSLNGAVHAASASFNVYQDGDTVFLEDERNLTLERIDPSYTTLADPVTLPPGARLSYGGNVVSIMAPDTGELWIVNAAGRLEFDPVSTEPNAQLGKGAQAVVSSSGVVFAVSPKGLLHAFPADGGNPRESQLPALTEFQLTAVGDRAVVLDTAGNRIVKDDGSTVPLPEQGLRLQQVGAAHDYVLVASATSLLKVPLTGGSVEVVPSNVSPSATVQGAVTAPVFLDGCAHGAWAAAQRYLLACDGQSAVTRDIRQHTAGGVLEFRVNRSVIVLNNLANGDVWILNDSMQLVDNWAEVTPPQDDDSTDGDEETAKQSFEDTLAERTETNHPPDVVNDRFGVRSGRTTILPVLDNDSDVDGDVLTISGFSDISEAIGQLELIDSGRALQFTPAEGAIGGTSFRYTASDGRLGGIAEGTVDVSIRPDDQNVAPVESRSGAVIVEAGQSVTYNVLADWIDPDGDDLQVVAAAPNSGDTVRFTPDGFITFQHASSELGIKEVTFTVSDGALTADGTLLVDVKPPGSLNPIGTPDFATAFVGAEVSVAPLSNDRSPSGEALQLLAVRPLEGVASFAPNLDRGTMTFSATSAGTYYFEYTLGAGRATSVGIIRVDVVPDPDAPLPPVAVKDVAYLRDSQPTLVPVLDNDISPSGAVLAIQRVDIPPESEHLSVEILNNTVLRITSATPLTEQLSLSYTVSDGVASSSAGVTIVPVTPLVKHQAPIAVDDLVTVRAGDIASVEVLKNDFHPDGVSMILAPELADPGSAGLAFVTGDTVRFQAPAEPGQYSVTYVVTDQFDESAVARVVFTVTAEDEENNRAPLPTPIVSRLFADANIEVKVPLQGIDPDGDSVTLVAFPGQPQLGDIVDHGTDYFVYQAYPDSAGTDSFTYQVMDSYGATALGSISIGVVPRLGSALQPTAVNDAISMRPERVASVEVLANDSDPNGYPIRVASELDVPEGISASVVDNRVVVESSEVEGPFAIGYTLTNGHGGTAAAVINVLVSVDAPPQYPTAIDHVLQQKDIAGKTSVAVDVLYGAQNPGGRISDLVVGVVGPNAAAASVAEGGMVEVTPGESQLAIAYTLSNEIDDLTSTAFIVVPPAPREGFADPPFLNPELPPQLLNMNEARSWNLADLVIVPSGRAPLLVGPDSVITTRSNGEPSYVDATTLRFTPEVDYRGAASIQFEVTDGSSASDPNGNRATLTLPLTVGDPNFEDISPTFTDSTVRVEAGGSTVVDLRQSTAHPSQRVIAAIQYGELSAQNATVSGNISGSNLTLEAPITAQVGTTAVYTFTLKFKDFVVTGSVRAEVVSSLKPRAQAVADAQKVVRGVTTVLSPLVNDVNPFPETPLRIIDAQFEMPAPGATMSFTASTITVSGTQIGDISIVYTVQDATRDDTRNVKGRAVVTVWDVPDQVEKPSISGWSDGQVTIQFKPPKSTNGSEVLPGTGYTVRSSPASATYHCDAGAPCTFTGLTNGTSYTFFVSAANEVGTSVESVASDPVTPYRMPSAPVSAGLSKRGDGYAPATLDLSWDAPSDDGGGVHVYNWEFIEGATNSGNTGSRTASVSNMPADRYVYRVQACNPAGCGTWKDSGSAVVETRPTAITISKGEKKPELSTAYYYHVQAVGFTANATFLINCYSNGSLVGNGNVPVRSDNVTILRFNGSGAFSGDVACWEGFGGANHVTINGVKSNTTSW